MNTLLFVSAMLASATTVGHFFGGYLMYMKPVMKSELNHLLRYMSLVIYHYMSVFLVLSTAVLFLAAFGVLGDGQMLLKLFIGFNYILMAVAQLLVVAASKIPNGALKMFQWMLFLATGIFAIAGTVMLTSLTTS